MHHKPANQEHVFNVLFVFSNHSSRTHPKPRSTTPELFDLFMENTGSRELIKSIMIMAGIPLAFSIACSLFARITEKNISSFQDQIQETKCDNMCHHGEDDTGYVNHRTEQNFTLRFKIEELQDLEKERTEFLQREVSSMEIDNKKFNEMVIEYLKALEELESSRLENSVLRRREKKLLKKAKESLRLIVKQNLKIKAQEADKLSNEVELEKKDVAIHGLEREVEETRAVIDRLQNEKNEVLKKLETTENTVASKADAERIHTENYNQVVNELANIKKDRASELKELVYLRWCHACLRHELARRNELEQDTKHDEEKVDNHELGVEVSRTAAREAHESGESVVHHAEPFFGPCQQHNKRGWLVNKFKKWVEGNEKHHEAKRF